MPSNDEDFSNNPGFLRYKIEQIEKLVYPLVETVNGLDKKVGLLAQKILIATLLIGGAFQVFGLWYSNNKSVDAYSDEDKKMYYEMRVSESAKVKELQDEIDRLKNKK